LPPLANHIHISRSNTTVNAIPPYTRIASVRCLHAIHQHGLDSCLRRCDVFAIRVRTHEVNAPK
jgi:hypothetical protein